MSEVYNDPEFAWMSGASIYDQQGVYGTKGVPSVSNILGARYGSISWIDSSGNLWLFGGQAYATTGDGYLNDLWKVTIPQEEH